MLSIRRMPHAPWNQAGIAARTPFGLWTVTRALLQSAHVARLAAAEIAAEQGLDADPERRLARRLENYFRKFFEAKRERF